MGSNLSVQALSTTSGGITDVKQLANILNLEDDDKFIHGELVFDSFCPIRKNPVPPIYPSNEMIHDMIYDMSLYSSAVSENEVLNSILFSLFSTPIENLSETQQLFQYSLTEIRKRANELYSGRIQKQNNAAQIIGSMLSHSSKKQKEISPPGENILNAIDSAASYNQLMDLVENHKAMPFSGGSKVIAKARHILSGEPSLESIYQILSIGFLASDITTILSSCNSLLNYSAKKPSDRLSFPFEKLKGFFGSLSLACGVFTPVNPEFCASYLVKGHQGFADRYSSFIGCDDRNVYLFSKNGEMFFFDLNCTNTNLSGRVMAKAIPNLNLDSRNHVIIASSNRKIIFSQLSEHPFFIFNGITKEIENNEPLFSINGSFSIIPQLRPPLTGDGKYIYSLNYPHGIAAFQVINQSIEYVRFIKLKMGTCPLLCPHDQNLFTFPLTNAPLVSNGIIASFLILNGSGEPYKYFVRSFSLITGEHIGDTDFIFEYKIRSVTYDSWNGCYWVAHQDNSGVRLVRIKSFGLESLWISGQSTVPSKIIKPEFTSIDDPKHLASSIISLLDLYSLHLNGISFAKSLHLLTFSFETARFFSPSTSDITHSIMEMLYSMKSQILSCQSSIDSNSLEMMLFLIRLLDININNFDPNVNNIDFSFKVTKRVVDFLISLITDIRFIDLRDSVIYLLVHCSSQLFKTEISLMPLVFNAIIENHNDTMYSFIIRYLYNNNLLVYCYDLPVFNKLILPLLPKIGIMSFNEDLMFICFSRSLYHEIKVMYSDNKSNTELVSIFNTFNLEISKTLLNFFDNIKDSIEMSMSENMQKLKFYHKWIIYLIPYASVLKFSMDLMQFLKPIYCSFCKTIKKISINNETKPELYQFYLSLNLIYMDLMSSLLLNTKELSNNSQFNWLFKSTLVAGLTMNQLDQILKETTTEMKSDLSLLKRGLSFDVSKQNKGADYLFPFLRQLISKEESSSIKHLMDYLVRPQGIRTRSIQDDVRYINRLVLAALMKQLGFSVEVLNLSLKMVDNETVILSHYVKQAAKLLEKTSRALLHSRQMRSSNSNDNKNQMSHSDYLTNITKKCLLLAYSDPCLRHQPGDREKAAPEIMNRLHNFIMSEFTVESYFEIIESTKFAQSNIKHGISLLQGWLDINDDKNMVSVFLESFSMNDSLLLYIKSLSKLSVDNFMMQEGVQSFVSIIEHLIRMLETNEEFYSIYSTFFFLMKMVYSLCFADFCYISDYSKRIMIAYSSIKTLPKYIIEAYSSLLMALQYVLSLENIPFLNSHLYQNAYIEACSSLNANPVSSYAFQLLYHPGMKHEMLLDNIINQFSELGVIKYRQIYINIVKLIESVPDPTEIFIKILGIIAIISKGELDLLPYQCQKAGYLPLCAILIQLSRRYLLRSETSSGKVFLSIIKGIFEKSLAENDSNDLLLLSLFAIMSECYDKEACSAFVTISGNPNLYCLSGFDQEKSQFYAYQLPISSSIKPLVVKLSDEFKFPPPIVFSPSMFPYFSNLIPIFLNVFTSTDDTPNNIIFRYYALSSLKAFSAEASFLNLFIPKLQSLPVLCQYDPFITGYLPIIRYMHPNPSITGPSKDGLANILHYFASPSALLPSSITYEKNVISCQKGSHVFLSDSLSDESKLTFKLKTENSNCDFGFFVVPNNKNAPYILNLSMQSGTIDGTSIQPKSIHIYLEKSSGMYIITSKSENECVLAKMRLSSSRLFFCIILRGIISIEYELNAESSINNELCLSNILNSQERFPRSSNLQSFVEYPDSLVEKMSNGFIQQFPPEQEMVPPKFHNVSNISNANSYFDITKDDSKSIYGVGIHKESPVFIYLSSLTSTLFPYDPCSNKGFLIPILVNSLRSSVAMNTFISAVSITSFDFESLYPIYFPNEHSIIRLILIVLIHLEPIKLIDSSIIDFEFNSLKFQNDQSQSNNFIKAALKYISEKGIIPTIMDLWHQIVHGLFLLDSSHSAPPSHPYATSFKFGPSSHSIWLTLKNVENWIIMTDSFGVNSKNICSIRDSSNNQYELKDQIVITKGKGFMIEQALSSDVCIIVAVPLFSDSKTSLFRTFFDLIVTFKYFVLMLANQKQIIDANRFHQMKMDVYFKFFDSIIARSPFFITYSASIIRFLSENLPLYPIDVSKDVVERINFVKFYLRNSSNSTLDRFIDDIIELYNAQKEIDFKAYFMEFASDEELPHIKPKEQVELLINQIVPIQQLEDNEIAKLSFKFSRKVFTQHLSLTTFPYYPMLSLWINYSLKHHKYSVNRIGENSYHVSISKPVPSSLSFYMNPSIRGVDGIFSFDPEFSSVSKLIHQSSIDLEEKSDIYVKFSSDKEIAQADPFIVFFMNRIGSVEYILNNADSFIDDMKRYIFNWDSQYDSKLLDLLKTDRLVSSCCLIDIPYDDLFVLGIKEPIRLLTIRIHLLYLFNFGFFKNYDNSQTDGMDKKFINFIHPEFKITLFKKSFESFNGDSRPSITIDRRESFYVLQGITQNYSKSLINQFSSIYDNPARFRNASDRPWDVSFVDERGIDVGGPARELVSSLAEDFMSPNCGLVTPTPNMRNRTGNNSDRMIPIPDPSITQPKSLYRIAGAVMGICIRTGIVQDFNFPSFFWEYMIYGKLSIQDVFSIDTNYQLLIESLQEAVESKMDDETFNNRFNLRFVVQNSAGIVQPITPSGRQELVTLSKCHSFIEKANAFRINELVAYLEPIKQGLWENLGISPPQFIDKRVLEIAACGQTQVSAESLISIIRWDGSISQQERENFANVIREMTSEQRALLVKFASGRSRPPPQLLSGNGFFLKVDRLSGSMNLMPTASTCFNTIHMPEYTNYEKMKQLIIVAIEFAGSFELS